VSELLAGLAGGLIATAGALGVQVLIGWQSNRRRRIELAATLIASARRVRQQWSVANTSYAVKDGAPAGLGVDVLFDHQHRASEVGRELIITSSPAVRTIVEVLLRSLDTLPHPDDAQTTEEWKRDITGHCSTLEQAMRPRRFSGR
jgi:hypothetical protein